MQRRTALAALAGAAAGPALALYDPPLAQALVWAPGTWAGTLTYRDWSQPDRLVTLRCRMFVAPTAPDAIALYYRFDDGPGKTVHGYDTMAFDFPAATLRWASGTAKPEVQQHQLSSVAAGADESRIGFERAAGAGVDRHTLQISRRGWLLEKTEFPASGAPVFRNRYELVRSEA
jgi:hypothetical protein